MITAQTTSSRTTTRTGPLGSEEGTTSEFATQEKVFDDLGILVLDHTFTGYNSCIFAYGQTGSGKTYCMMGTPTDEGLIPRIAQKIFGYADSIRQQNTKVAIEVSYLEIYCEKVRCLLDPQVGHYDGTKTLKVREASHHGSVRRRPCTLCSQLQGGVPEADGGW